MARLAQLRLSMSVAILLVPSPSKEAYGSPSSPTARTTPYTNKGKTGKVNVYFIPYSLNK